MYKKCASISLSLVFKPADAFYGEFQQPSLNGIRTRVVSRAHMRVHCSTAGWDAYDALFGKSGARKIAFEKKLCNRARRIFQSDNNGYGHVYKRKGENG